MIFDDLVRPNPEGRTLYSVYPITDRNNQIQIIYFELSLCLSFSLLLNLCNFCTSCLFLQSIPLIGTKKIALNPGWFIWFSEFPVTDWRYVADRSRVNITIACYGFVFLSPILEV